nr:CDP-alcohol phosphatidyltransferase family protein [Candidatus Sigynarchaeota archaeon]
MAAWTSWMSQHTRTSERAMPSRFRLRLVFKPLVAVVAKGMARRGITPNQATGFMCLFSIACLAYFLLVPLNWATMIGWAALVFVTGVMDGVDGAIARSMNLKTRFGGVLDSSMDRISDAVIFFTPAMRELLLGDLVASSWLRIPFLEIVPFWAWSLLLVMGAYMTSYLRARVTLAEPTTDVDVGLLGRSERLFIVVVASACNVVPLSVIVLSILTNLTALFRIKDARARLAGKKSG